MKSITLTGHLGKDAEILNNENKDYFTLMFSVAHTEKWTDKDGKQQEKTEWFNCFKRSKKDPKNVAEIMKTGLKVLVIGVPSFEVKQTDKGIFANTNIDVSTIDFMSKKD